MYICSRYTVFNMQKDKNIPKTFKPKQHIQRGKEARLSAHTAVIQFKDSSYSWSNQMDKVGIIRDGLPYESIEIISKRIDLPIKQILRIIDLPQTTYNKKLRENSLLNGRDSEIILFLTELIDFGIEVFNNEKDKFQRWLKKPNLSLGAATPESLFDSITGIQEVRNCLNRIEYGNFA